MYRDKGARVSEPAPYSALLPAHGADEGHGTSFNSETRRNGSVFEAFSVSSVTSAADSFLRFDAHHDKPPLATGLTGDVLESGRFQLACDAVSGHTVSFLLVTVFWLFRLPAVVWNAAAKTI